MYGNDIVLTNSGGTFNITPSIPNFNEYRITSSGTLTLSAGVAIQYDTSYTPSKWDVYKFDYESSINMNGETVTIFGTALTKEQCMGKGIIVCLYDGSAWVVRYYPSTVSKATGIGGMTTNTVLTNGGGTIDMDIRKSDNTLVLSGNPTLKSSWTIQTAGTAVSGDMQIVVYKATATVGANTVTILGKQLTTQQALAGNSIVISAYDGSGWNTIFIDADVESIWEVGSGALSAQTIGTGCTSVGDNSVACGDTNTASGDGSATIGGGNNTASGLHATISGGSINTASGDDSAISGGTNNIASGYNSFIGGGDNNKSSGNLSTSSGVDSVSHLYASSSFSNGKFSIQGDAQRLEVQLKKSTTDATPAYMLLGDGATEIAIPTDCAIKFTIEVLATQYGGAGGDILDTFSQTIKLTVKNIAGVSSIVPQNSVTLANYSVVAGDVLYELSSCDAAFAGTVTVSVAANTLHVEVTGEATKSILWLADVRMVMLGTRNYSI